MSYSISNLEGKDGNKSPQNMALAQSKFQQSPDKIETGDPSFSISSRSDEEERKDITGRGQEFNQRSTIVSCATPPKLTPLSSQQDEDSNGRKTMIQSQQRQNLKEGSDSKEHQDDTDDSDEDQFLERRMNALLSQKQSRSGGFYSRRTTAAKYNPQQLEKQRLAAQFSMQLDADALKDELQKNPQQKNQKDTLCQEEIKEMKNELSDDAPVSEGKSDTAFSAGKQIEIEDFQAERPQTPKPDGQVSDQEEDGLSSDFSFEQEHFFMMNLEEPRINRKSTKKQIRLHNDDIERDVIKIVDSNERRHQELAREQLKVSSVISLKNIQVNNQPSQILSEFKVMSRVSYKLVSEKQFSNARATCLDLSDELLLIGNSEGQLWMFDRESEEEYSMHQEKGKDFVNNAVTALDIHPTRPEYVAIGYEKGQLALIDVTEPEKTLKLIKDHHKGAPISNIKFCDWTGKHSEHHPEAMQNVNEDKQIWMFISIDTNGRVVVNTIDKIVFIYKASKHVVVDPTKDSQPIFQSLSTRFYSQMHPQGDENDSATLSAIGNAESVQVLCVKPSKHKIVMRLGRPKRFYSKKLQQYHQMKPCFPSIAWGYGHSPILKDRCYAMLAIAWGPLIQLIVLNNLELQNECFFKEGYYLLKSNEQNVKEQSPYVNKRLGREIQNNSVDNDSIEEESDDEGVSFLNPGLNIESMKFIAESTLLVVTSNLEVRVLYTQAFCPQEYTNESSAIRKLEKNTQAERNQKPQPELEIVQLPSQLTKSEHGTLYHQTIKEFKGMVSLISTKNVLTCHHLTWMEYLDIFKQKVRGDWIKVFAKSLDFFQGKIKGYAGVSEDKEIRENLMKAELKLLIREIIYEVIEKWRHLSTSEAVTQRSPEQKDDSQYDILDQLQTCDKKHEKTQKYRTLIRVAIEFCVELQDCYFLFYDMFLLFQDEKMEDLFIQEMEPFIMAGRFQEWELPNDILQNHIINYYKDAERPENLEKIIINLNFTQCPKQVVLELIHFSEKHYLTTAILFLYTQVFERKDVSTHIHLTPFSKNSSCMQVLFSLHNLYNKAGTSNKGSLQEVHQLKDLPGSHCLRNQIEKTQVYIGYKILWVIKLFLNGKKFPQGNLREMKWRTYVHDIIEFITNLEIMEVLLNIDAEAFFQIISILFYEGKQFDFVKMGRNPLPFQQKHLISEPLKKGVEKAFQTATDPSTGNLVSLSHKDLLQKLDQLSQSPNLAEETKLQYLFFVANVAAKSKIDQEPSFYYRIIKELMNQQNKFLSFNKHLLERALTKKQLMRRMSRLSPTKTHDDVKHVLKSENDTISLLKMCEPLSTEQISELLKLSEYTQLQAHQLLQLPNSNQIKVYLYEKREDYTRCLQLFLRGMRESEVWSTQQSQENVFQWIKDKLYLLEQRSKEEGGRRSSISKLKVGASHSLIYEQFKREIQQNIKQMVALNALETIKLIEEKFEANHKEMVNTLHRDTQEQLIYLEALLRYKDSNIQETIRDYSLKSENPHEAKKYLELLKQHLRLSCQLKKDQVLDIVKKIVTHSYYPTEDCLQICQEYKQVEACALLNKKLGKYYESVQNYIMIMKDDTDLTQLKKELFHAKEHGLASTFPIKSPKLLGEVSKLDYFLNTVMKICQKNYKEVDIGKEEEIWYLVLDALFKLKQNPVVIKKSYCQNYFKARTTIFVQALVEHIPFKNFLSHILAVEMKVQFKDLKQVILNIFNDRMAEQIIINNANNAIHKVNTDLFSSYQEVSASGTLFRMRCCQLCNKYFDSFLYVDEQRVQGQQVQRELSFDPYTEEIKIFSCCHPFHVKCLKNLCGINKSTPDDIKRMKMEKQQCPKCYNKDFDIEGTKGTPVRARNRGLSNQQFGDISDTSSVSSKDNLSSGDRVKSPPVKRVKNFTRSKTMIDREVSKLQKKMENFDSAIEHEGLTSKNFKS